MASAGEEFWSGRRYVVVGVRAPGRRIVPEVVRTMRRAGYEVALVDAGGGEFLSQPVARSVAEAGGSFDGALVMCPAEGAEAAVQECAEAGIGRVWLHTLGKPLRARARAEAARMEVVYEVCPLLLMPGAGAIHRLHHWLAAIFGRLPADG